MARRKYHWGALSLLIRPVLGRNGLILLKWWQHLMEHKGAESLVRRLKAMYTSILHIDAGEVQTAAQILREVRIRTCKEYPHIPRGIEGQLFHNFIHTKSWKVKRMILAILRAYTGIYLVKVSKSQAAKALENITKPREWRRNSVRDSDIRFPLPKWALEYRMPETLPPASVLSGVSAYPMGFLMNKQLRQLPYSTLAGSLLTKGKVPTCLTRMYPQLRLRELAEQYQSSREDNSYGKISILQEGGAKARTVCMPNAWLQLYFYPLHQALARVIQRLEVFEKSSFLGRSVMFNQVEGAWLMKTWLHERKETPVYSIDISAATDRFPRFYQANLLHQMRLPSYAEALDEISRGPYHFPQLNTEVGYKVGQPMGLYGSFPLFHLTHFLVLENLARSLNLKEGLHYCVLGDDVLIRGKDLADKYLNFLDSRDVPLSLSKCFMATNVAEFAGFIGLTNDLGETVFRPFKHGPHYRFDGRFVNVLATFRERTKSWSKWWASALQVFEQTLPMRDLDLSPLISEDRESVTGFSSTGSRWVGSIINRLALFDAIPKYDWEAFRALWTLERGTLFGGPDTYWTTELEDGILFDPSLYTRCERERKAQMEYDALMLRIQKATKQQG